MADITTVPQIVNITHYAGDTLTIVVTAPSSLVAGRTWDAQVRSSRESTTVDGTFDITPPTLADGPAYLVLQQEVTSALGAMGELVTDRSGKSTIKYNGVWDCQVSADGDDPVTTLVQGNISFIRDVTRIGTP